MKVTSWHAVSSYVICTRTCLSSLSIDPSLNQSIRINQAVHVRWPSSTFFEIRFKIKWLEKECIFQNFDQNKVHFNQNLGSKSSAFQASESKAVKSSAAASPAADLARRAWLRWTRDEGGTTIRFRIFRRRGGGTGVTSREENFDQNKVEA